MARTLFPPFLAGLFLLALALRLAFLFQLYHTPYFSLLVVDAAEYDRWAREIASGNWLGNRVFYQAPLYPYFLGLIYRVFGPSLLAARIVQAGIGSASCVLLALAGRRFFGPRAGLVAGLLLAVYPTAIFFDYLIQKSVLDLLLVCLLLLLLGRVIERPRAGTWLGTGITLGCLVLTRENAAVLVPVAAAWLAVRTRVPWRRLLGMGSLFCLGLALTLGPVALRNRAVGGEFVLSTFQGGSNFYIGNNPGSRGTYVPLREGRYTPTFEREDAVRLAERAAGRKLTPREISAYWRGKAFAFILERPAEWLRLMGRKALLVINRAEVADTEDQTIYAEWSPLLGLSGRWLHFGLLFPLAAAGVVLTRRAWRRLWVLYAFILAYAASVVLFYVFARYRFPLVPALILFAAAGLTEAVRSMRYGELRGLWIAGAVLVPAALIANLPLDVPDDAAGRMMFLTNYAGGLISQSKSGEAIPLLEEVLRGAPDSTSVSFNLAVALKGSGRRAEALALLNTLADRVPDDSSYPALAGQILLETGDARGAVLRLSHALSLDPDAPQIENHLGFALIRAGQPEEALPHFARAVSLDPASASMRLNYGSALLDKGQAAKALPELEAAVRLDHRLLPARLRAAQALGALGREGDALTRLREALAIAGDDPVLLSRFAWLLLCNTVRAPADVEQARQLAAQAVERSGSSDPFALAVLAAAEALTGRRDEAIRLARKAAALGLTPETSGVFQMVPDMDWGIDPNASRGTGSRGKPPLSRQPARPGDRR